MSMLISSGSYHGKQRTYSPYELLGQVCISNGTNADSGVLRNSPQSLGSFIKGKKGLFRGQKLKVVQPCRSYRKVRMHLLSNREPLPQRFSMEFSCFKNIQMKGKRNNFLPAYQSSAGKRSQNLDVHFFQCSSCVSSSLLPWNLIQFNKQSFYLSVPKTFPTEKQMFLIVHGPMQNEIRLHKSKMLSGFGLSLI